MHKLAPAAPPKHIPTMMEPRYRGVLAAEIPKVTDADGVEIKIIAGTAAGVTGPVRDVVTAPEYLDVIVPGKPIGEPIAWEDPS